MSHQLPFNFPPTKPEPTCSKTATGTAAELPTSLTTATASSSTSQSADAHRSNVAAQVVGGRSNSFGSSGVVGASDTTWPDLGRWMVGEGPEPAVLAARAIARAHRRRMDQACGRAP